MRTLRIWLRIFVILLAVPLISSYLLGIPPFPVLFRDLLLFLLVILAGAAVLVDRKIKKNSNKKADNTI